MVKGMEVAMAVEKGQSMGNLVMMMRRIIVLVLDLAKGMVGMRVLW